MRLSSFQYTRKGNAKHSKSSDLVKFIKLYNRIEAIGYDTGIQKLQLCFVNNVIGKRRLELEAPGPVAVHSVVAVHVDTDQAVGFVGVGLWTNKRD